MPMSTKGFTLTEILLVLFITSLVFLISPQFKLSKPYIDIELFESTVINSQVLSLYSHQEFELKTDQLTSYPIRFSALGNIHFPQTIIINEEEIVMSLGPGRIYEKRKYLD